MCIITELRIDTAEKITWSKLGRKEDYGAFDKKITIEKNMCTNILYFLREKVFLLIFCQK